VINGFNFVLLLGTVDEDPVERSPGDVRQATFQLVTRRTWTDPTTRLTKDQRQSHQIVVFNQLVDVVIERVKKGDIVIVNGMNQYHRKRDGGTICQVKATFIEKMETEA